MLTRALKARQTRLQDEKGFTLIELLAVIVILGIIAVIAIPLIGNIIDNSKKDSDVATARQIYDASRLYIVGEEGGKFKSASVDIADIMSAGYLEESLSLPSTKERITGGSVVFDVDGQLVSVSITPAPEGAGTDGSYTAEQVLSSDADKNTTPDKKTE